MKTLPFSQSVRDLSQVEAQLFRQDRGPRRQFFGDGVEEKLLFATAGPNIVFVKTVSICRL